MAEKEYIERNALQEIFENRMQDNNIMCPVIKVLDVIEIIEKQPAADVVEVVRCKDCVLHGHCRTEDVFLFSRLKSENAFCCVGKRKEN